MHPLKSIVLIVIILAIVVLGVYTIGNLLSPAASGTNSNPYISPLSTPSSADNKVPVTTPPNTPTGAPQSPTVTPQSASQNASVVIQNFAFNPPVLTIPAGTTVTWTNEDTTAHTVTSNSSNFDSGTLATGQSYSMTFSVPGTYTYHCAIHPNMQGTIIVQ